MNDTTALLVKPGAEIILKNIKAEQGIIQELVGGEVKERVIYHPLLNESLQFYNRDLGVCVLFKLIQNNVCSMSVNNPRLKSKA
ncbi:hypothetical protein U8V72_18220 [Priestia filamentosa]|uniref:hypothetical protein n=1 Tax=Priestia filamentosa TaxID=1402861 RepID=UPI0005894D35